MPAFFSLPPVCLSYLCNPNTDPNPCLSHLCVSLSLSLPLSVCLSLSNTHTLFLPLSSLARFASYLMFTTATATTAAVSCRPACIVIPYLVQAFLVAGVTAALALDLLALTSRRLHTSGTGGHIYASIDGAKPTHCITRVFGASIHTSGQQEAKQNACRYKSTYFGTHIWPSTRRGNHNNTWNLTKKGTSERGGQEKGPRE